MRTFKLAIYRSLEYGSETVHEAHEWMDDADMKYLRLSEIVEVEFPMIPKVDITGAQIKAFRAEKDRIQAETHIKLENLENQIQELLALPAPEAV